MKKALSVFLALALCVGMCATITSCNKKIKVNPDKEHYVVGICQLASHESSALATKGFKDALTEALAADGKTVEFNEQNAEGDLDACEKLAKQLASDKVDLILADSTPALSAAHKATKTIPVLGAAITDYGVALGIEDFAGSSGINVSGSSDLVPLVEQAQVVIDVLKLTSDSRVGVIYCSAEPNSAYQASAVLLYLNQCGINANVYTFAQASELEATVKKAAGKCNALYFPTDNTIALNEDVIRNVCGPARIPVCTGYESDISFASLTPDYYNLGAETGKMAADVLLGREDITKLAIHHDEHPVYKYNKSICAELGIDTAALDAGGYINREAE